MNSGGSKVARDWNNALPYLRHYLSLPSALGWRVGAAAFALYVVGQVLIDRGRYGGDFWPWVQAALMLQVAVLAVLVIGGQIVFARPASNVTPLLVLLVYAIAQVVRGVLAGAYVVATVPNGQLELLYRSVFTLPSGITTGIGLAVLFGARDEHRRLISDLSAKRASSLEIRQTLTQRLNRSRQELIEAIQVRLAPSTAELEYALSAAVSAANRQQTVRRIQEIINRDIRPLSRTIELPPVSTGSVPPTPRVREQWPRQLLGSELFFPKATAVWITALNFSQVARDNFAPLPLAVLLLQGILVWLLITALENSLQRVRLALWAGLAIASLGTALAAVLAAQVYELIPFVQIPGLLPANFVVSLTIGLALALFSAVTAQRRATERAWAEAVEELRWSTNLLEQRQWVAVRRLRHVLHGALQGALVAAAIKLANANSVDDVLVSEIRADIKAALDRLVSGGDDYTSITEGVEQLQTAWRGVSELSYRLSPAAVAACAADQTLGQCALEVAVEAVGNAVRHGSATQCELSVDLVEDILQVVVIDDGCGPSPEAVPGVGSHCFNEACLDWRLVRSGDRTHFVASFAVA